MRLINRITVTDEENEAILTYVARWSTPEQAKLIIERNEAALNVLDEIEERDKTIPLGCPHCHYNSGCYNCRNCLWTQAYKEVLKVFDDVINDDEIPLMCCCHVKFKGINLFNAPCVCLGAEYIEVLTYSKETYDIPTDDDIRDTKDFLEGHIEWAKREDWGNSQSTSVEVAL